MRGSISDRNDGCRDDNGYVEIASESICEESNEQNHAQQSQLCNGLIGELIMELLGMLLWFFMYRWGPSDSEAGRNRYWEDPDFQPVDLTSRNEA